MFVLLFTLKNIGEKCSKKKIAIIIDAYYFTGKVLIVIDRFLFSVLYKKY